VEIAVARTEADRIGRVQIGTTEVVNLPIGFDRIKT
jgi:hypothetical protein